jgi:phytoene dehydrogenase-like protein
MPSTWLARLFRSQEARALLAGAAAHSMLALDKPLTGAFALLFVALGHTYGWPVIAGGSARLVDALVAELTSMGGEVLVGRWVRSLDELGRPGVALMDVSARQLARLLGAKATPVYQKGLDRYRYGPGVCKVDWALSGPVPWEAPACRNAVTLHVGGTFEEIAAAEAEVAAGLHPERPFCIVVQAGVVDGARAPAGRQTLWAYCHVPAGSPVDMTDRIEAQIERFAPGFRDLVMARVGKTAAQAAEANPNYVGGDINGGLATLRQTLFRPTFRWDNYRTGAPGVYLCSASSPPGGGVHGMCGYWAARTALKDLAGRS